MKGPPTLLLWIFLVVFTVFGIVAPLFESTPECSISEPPPLQPRVFELKRKNSLQFGVNLWGYIRGDCEQGIFVRSIAAALLAAKVPFVIIDIHKSIPHELEFNIRMEDHSFDEFTRDINEAAFYFNLICWNPTQAPLIRKHITSNYSAGHYNIGLWFWDLALIPSEWVPHFSLFEEIWTLSDFTRNSMVRYSPKSMRAPVPITKIRLPLPCLSSTTSLQYSRSHFNISKDDFVFFFEFDFLTWSIRKNPLGSIKAFHIFYSTLRFVDRSKVLLLIKADHLTLHSKFTSEYKELHWAARGARINFIDSELNSAETCNLFQLIDVYVSLHRSEAFGLGIAHAMANEKPCIVTDYSGSQEFCTNRTAYLVPCGYSSVPFNSVSRTLFLKMM